MKDDQFAKLQQQIDELTIAAEVGVRIGMAAFVEPLVKGVKDGSFSNDEAFGLVEKLMSNFSAVANRNSVAEGMIMNAQAWAERQIMQAGKK